MEPIYPWNHGKWDDLPAKEEPVDDVRRPPHSDRPFGGTFGIKESVQGMETLVMLTRKTPLPKDVDLKAKLGEVPAQEIADAASRGMVRERRVSDEGGGPLGDRLGRGEDRRSGDGDGEADSDAAGEAVSVHAGGELRGAGEVKASHISKGIANGHVT